MKTSTKILLTYVALILALILTLFILAKNNVEIKKANQKGTVVTTFSLDPSFNVVVVDSSCVCQITLEDSAHITWTHRDDDLDYGNLTRLSHDTLYVIKTPNREPEGMVIHTTAIKSVVARHFSTVALVNATQVNLTIVNQNGDVVLKDYVAEGVNKIDTLNLTVLADNGRVLVETAFKSLSATMNGGELIANQTVGQSVDLNLTNKATVRLAKSPGTMTVKTDQTSKVVIED
ncbi:MAG: hypothetical protein GXY09_08240 [Bacteroidales bacterium]|nr:hypothetical protein [Bacteroidales bacterium]